ncbi:MAG: zinc metallopeptidase [Bacteroidia bacterium]|nr:zinc metallopeptidase [Bacteroidia bacterium]NNF32115.1 zinc metallopeptidase [Flavobacteriaceae bacterium]MBT8275154.1 zinc metallopeptidase [Bacteroidia bacterium]NNJ82235.1 zinc metallopeptidase [Flavobacteriaceae bacterium]NNK54979.1 zinc metallopeptidase [Flavobacteriaceae bacterium]
MMGYYILAGVIFLVSMLVSNRLKSKFKKYSKVQLQNGMSGKEIAEKMLRDNGIYDVQVVSVQGMLTDHYNPKTKTVNLSEGVYLQRNAAAAAVAAHECGHAVQHATAYGWLQMRSSIVPMVGIASKLSNFVIMAGLVLTFSGIAFGNWIFLVGIGLFAMTTVFSFITLPVEYDASNRALAWLQNNNMVNQQEYSGAKDALKWAARTYVVAALGSLATLIYFISIFLGGRD